MIYKKQICLLILGILLIAASATFYFKWHNDNLLPEPQLETCIDVTSIATENTKNEPLATTTPSVLIFNVNGVIFKEDFMRIVKKIGFGRLTSFALSNFKNPVDVCLDILHKMALEQCTNNSRKIIYQGRNLPGCIVDWQLGQCTYVDVQKKLKDYIHTLDEQKYFSNTNERDVIYDILNIAFDPAQFSEATKPATSMVSILQELKKRGYILYVLTNMPHEMRTAIMHSFPDIMNLFDGVIISADAQALKTEEQLFNYFLTNHSITPSKCTFIDDEPVAIEIAKKLGMHGILFSDAKALKKELQQLHLL